MAEERSTARTGQLRDAAQPRLGLSGRLRAFSHDHAACDPSLDLRGVRGKLGDDYPRVAAASENYAALLTILKRGKGDVDPGMLHDEAWEKLPE